MVSSASISEPLARTRAMDGDAPYPLPPSTIRETGLSRELLLELVMKTLYFGGRSTGQEVARTLRLSYSVLDEIFQHLRSEQYVEVKGLEAKGKLIYAFDMTDAGRRRTREFIERSQYVGPAPVSLSEYAKWVRQQSVGEAEHDADFLRRGLRDLVISEEMLNRLGPAVVSGRSIFLYGPAGNGKTVIAEAVAAALGGTIFVPHAIEVSGQIIKVFDPSHHAAVDGRPMREDATGIHDARWVRVRRPVVLTGGELTLPMLDLRFNPSSRYYEAPFQVKANGGVLVIDDFGRQLVKPEDLLNRWIVPLEKREDHLTLHTGVSFAVPFDVLIVFATNLNPWDLVDEAFLRRIRYKIPVDNPTREQYEALFERFCEAHGVEYRAEAVALVYEEYYGRRGIAPRFCHPRDLLDHLVDGWRYHGTRTAVTPAAIAEACEAYFLDSPFALQDNHAERAARLA